MAAGGDQDRGELNRPDPRVATGEQHASAHELRGLIERTIDGMPPLQAQALLLFVRAEMPQKEIAQMLGCSVEAVKWHVFSARKKLKEVLKDYL